MTHLADACEADAGNVIAELQARGYDRLEATASAGGGCRRCGARSTVGLHTAQAREADLWKVYQAGEKGRTDRAVAAALAAARGQSVTVPIPQGPGAAETVTLRALGTTDGGSAQDGPAAQPGGQDEATGGSGGADPTSSPMDE